MKTLLKLLISLLALVVTEAHAMRWHSSNTGRWLSRDPIEEQGGVNLYGFVGNGPVNAVDAFGLYTKSGTTFSVPECEILIVYGHQSPVDPWKFSFPPPGQVAAGGAVVCWPGRANKGIPQHNKIPAPEHDSEIWWWRGTGSQGALIDIHQLPSGAEELKTTTEKARKKAEVYLKRCLCKKVTITFYRAGNIPGLSDKGIPDKPADETFPKK